MQQRNDNATERLSPPVEIQRPSSALHAGDFTQDTAGPTSRPLIPTGHGLETSPTIPCYTPSASFGGHQPGPQPHQAGAPTDLWVRKCLRNRGPSVSSVSSSYILKPPTSPLVQQSNNTDLDFSPADHSPTSDRINRRYTLPPHALPASSSSPMGPSTSSTQDAWHGPRNPRDSGVPYQRHYARRSLTSNWSLQISSSPQSPAYLRSRRTSYSETSPLQNASMVGSYEESILRGSMSTAPSKPLDFTAQIGVLGKGNCKPKCPAHVVIPFPAVFYSCWGGSGGRNQSLGDGEPSPYVGHIDLQSSLPPPERRRGKGHDPVPGQEAAHGSSRMGHAHDGNIGNPDTSSRKHNKRRRSPTPAVAPPGGSYRIPQQGQLQIIIKNPNKTAVKLFLVPYDLTGMEPETKTFIRQRCYSTDVVDDGVVTSKPDPTQPGLLSRLDEIKKKPTLRYLVHLNICSLSPGRFYLYQQIRVVFANRVPDNKELLRNEIQVPQPRFSPYRPTQDTTFGVNASPSARITNEKAYRRRSSGYEPYSHVGGTHFSFHTSTPAPPIPPIPFDLTNPSTSKRRSQFDVGDDRRPASIEPGELVGEGTAPHRGTASQIQPSPPDPLIHMALCSSYLSSSSNSSEGYEKLNRGESGYGGVFFGRDGSVEGGEGLLARKLKGLGVRGMERMGEEG